jgi:hypothetical protein
MQKYFHKIKMESTIEMQALGDTTNNTTNTETCKKLVGKTNKWWKLNDKTQCMGWKNQSWTFPNGMRMDWALEDGGWYACTITSIDVNGGKGPNTWGRDVFYFIILPNGHIIPSGGVEHMKAKFKYNNDTSDPVAASQDWIETRCATDKSKANSTYDGQTCSARIIENGWVMDY